MTLEQPFAIAPGPDTVATIMPLQENYLLIGNKISDTGIAIQLFGIAINDIIAENSSTRGGGFRNWALNYEGGVQPSWYVQYFDNELAGATPWADSHLAVISSSQGEYRGPLARFVVMRRNALRNNSRIEVRGRPRISSSRTTGLSIPQWGSTSPIRYFWPETSSRMPPGRPPLSCCARTALWMWPSPWSEMVSRTQ